jgi:hypothetical protein
MNNYLYDYRLTIFYIFINFSKLTKFKYFVKCNIISNSNQ